MMSIRAPRERARAAFSRHRRGAVAVLFAISAVPLIAMVGLAIDYNNWSQINSSLQLAADTAALNAAKIAGNDEVAAKSQAVWVADGTAAGKAWFNAVATLRGASVTPSVTICPSSAASCPVGATTTITAMVSYAGSVPSVFGRIFYGKASYGFNGASAATVTVAPFLDVEVMLDNSSSMQQGASVTDIENMDYWSACNPYLAWRNLTNTPADAPTGIEHGTPVSGHSYDIDSNGLYSGQGFSDQPWWSYAHYTNVFNDPNENPNGSTTYNANFPGAVPYPVPISGNNNGQSPDTAYGPLFPAWPTQPSPGTGYLGGPICKGFYDQPVNFDNYPLTPAKALPTRAGEPCAFACHDDNRPNILAGQGNDLYALARQTIGTSRPVQLRFDIVKLATNAILKAMQADDLAIRNLNVGVFTFSDQLKQIYPTKGSTTCSSGAPAAEACDDWPTAITDVGLPPTTKGGADTGIQAELLVGSSSHFNTDFTGTMTDLKQNYLTASGSGATASSPRKVLFLISDGILENAALNSCGNHDVCKHSAFDYTQCDAFKNMGYTIYVAYTPYAPYPDYWYQQVQPFVEGIGVGAGTASVKYNLQNCASDPDKDFIVASDLPTLNAALNTFLKLALNTPARFTQ